jgi:hypothetical protein
MVIVPITRASVVISFVVVSIVVVSFHSVSWTVAWATHAVSGPAVSPVTIINYTTVHRTDRQNGKEYRRNELLQVESFVNQGGFPSFAIFYLASGVLCELTRLVWDSS